MHQNIRLFLGSGWLSRLADLLPCGFNSPPGVKQSSNKSTPVLSLSEYRQMVGSIARPTDDQVERFIGYVVRAHSWYKHLPAFSPGKPFQFYLNPNAGCELVLKNNGQWCYRERTETTEKFHYTWMTTARYREQFGYLDYYTSAGTRFILPRKEGKVYIGETFSGLLGKNGRACSLPTIVEQAGTVNLTAVMDSMLSNPHYWLLIHLGDDDSALATWPESTGGNQTLDCIREICRRFDRIRTEVGSDNSPQLDALKEQLQLLLQPERERQLSLIRQSVRATIRIVYE